MAGPTFKVPSVLSHSTTARANQSNASEARRIPKYCAHALFPCCAATLSRAQLRENHELPSFARRGDGGGCRSSEREKGGAGFMGVRSSGEGPMPQGKGRREG